MMIVPGKGHGPRKYNMQHVIGTLVVFGVLR